jgi:beta-N-acetylhexosaminidase
MKKYLVIILIVIIPLSFNLLKENKESRKLKNEIGQMLIVGFRGNEINKKTPIYKTIKKLNLGGVILFDRDIPSSGQLDRNIINYDQTKKLVADLKEISPLFIAVDAEGGYINRLKEKYGFKNIPSALELGKSDPKNTEDRANQLGEQLSDIGFNLNFAPVVDLNTNPDNPVIGYLERSFSDDPKIVFDHASAFIKGLNNNGVISAIKHFPGHGSSKEDSHLGITDITNYYQEKELLPYSMLISNGYSDMVMTAHVINKNIDSNYPATLSPLFLQDILRNKLKFNGVIVSDDMQMGAIVDNYGFGESLIRSINAGCDILILSNNGTSYNENIAEEAVNLIFKAVKDGLIDETKIKDSYNRIINLKNKYRII